MALLERLAVLEGLWRVKPIGAVDLSLLAPNGSFSQPLKLFLGTAHPSPASTNMCYLYILVGYADRLLLTMLPTP